VDLGYAPGSWSQVAVERTKPTGRIVGIDIIPAQPPKGVSTIQGNFLSPGVQAEVKSFLSDPERGRPRQQLFSHHRGDATEVIEEDDRSYIDLEQHANEEEEDKKRADPRKMVDVVLSDMMMNTSGIAFKDHAGNMDLCSAALTFAQDTLKVGGHFVCKFYQGSEDKALEMRLKKLFKFVHREKPESSRSESKEAYFVAIRRKSDEKQSIEEKEPVENDTDKPPLE